MIAAAWGMLLLSAIGAALVMTTTSETMIAATFRRGQEGLYAADAALERALDDIRAAPSWDAILDGSTHSAFVDGLPGGTRTLSDGSAINLSQRMNLANCSKPTACSASDVSATTLDRPWGTNNPVWRLYAYGPLRALLLSATIDSPYYVMVMAADDPGRSADVLWLRAEAFGPRGVHRTIELTAARAGGADGRVLSWREVR